MTLCAWHAYVVSQFLCSILQSKYTLQIPGHIDRENECKCTIHNLQFEEFSIYVCIYMLNSLYFVSLSYYIDCVLITSVKFTHYDVTITAGCLFRK